MQNKTDFTSLPDSRKKHCYTPLQSNNIPSTSPCINARFCLTPPNFGLESAFLEATQQQLSSSCNVYSNKDSTKDSNIANIGNIAAPTPNMSRLNQIIPPVPSTITSPSLASMANKSIFSTIIPTLSQKLSALMPSGSTTNSQDKLKIPNDKCVHPSHNAMPMTSCLTEIPIEYYERQLKKYTPNCASGLASDTAKINGQLNEIFLKRLKDIDANAGGCLKLKLVTYQEWVDMLLKVNESFISNMDTLETEIAERLELVQQCMNANYQRMQCQELLKCRKDIDHLIKVIQDAYHNDKWDIKNVLFETISPTQILNVTDLNRSRPKRSENGDSHIKNNTDGDNVEKCKQLFRNMKTLAFEVAEKYDETRMLKEHIFCLENEIQNAQKKIQLKDDVIKELRNDLKCFNNKVSINYITCAF